MIRRIVLFRPSVNGSMIRDLYNVGNQRTIYGTEPDYYAFFRYDPIGQLKVADSSINVSVISSGARSMPDSSIKNKKPPLRVVGEFPEKVSGFL